MRKTLTWISAFNGIVALYWRFKYERKNFSKLSALYWKEEAILFSKKARYS